MENMEELIDLLVKDESPSQISDAIKDVLFAKSAERIETSRPDIAASLFGDSESVFPFWPLDAGFNFVWPQNSASLCQNVPSQWSEVGKYGK